MFSKYSRICFYCLYLRTVVGKASCSKPPDGVGGSMPEPVEEVPLGSILLSKNPHD